MKALILAGGVGTRMRPLSCTRPKLLFPILNKPLLDITLERLAQIGVDGVILAVKFMANMLMQRYGKKMYDVNISYSLEKTPMGTGGAIKYAEDKIGHDEPFLVLNGDIFTTINYGALIKKHKKSNAVATIALYRVKDPSRYGTVKLTKNNQITQFVEKAPLGQEPSQLINAGVYVLDPKIFDYIPESETFSIERQVFPKLAAKGKMFGHEFKEIWIDIGKPIDYIRANRMLFDSKEQKRIIGNNIRLGNEVKLSDPVKIDSEVSVGKNTKIGSYTVIGKSTSLGKNVCIRGSIVFPHVTIEDNAIINNAIIGEGALIGAGAKINEECIIGDYAIIHSDVVLERNVTVCHSKEVKENIPESKRII